MTHEHLKGDVTLVVWRGMFTRKKLSILLLCFCALSPAWGDTVYLKDGTVLKGAIVAQSRREIRLRAEGGGAEQRITKDRIRRIVFGKTEAPTPAEIAAREEERKSEAARRAARQKEVEERARAADTRVVDQRTRLGALWRSAVLPGWGQAYSGRTNAAYALGGGFAASGLWSLYSYREFAVARTEYNSAAALLGFAVVGVGAGVNLLDTQGTTAASLQPAVLGLEALALIQRNQAFDRAQQSRRRLTWATTVLGAVYLWNLVDVVIFYPAPNTTVSLYSAPGAAEPEAGLRLSFQF